MYNLNIHSCEHTFAFDEGVVKVTSQDYEMIIKLKINSISIKDIDVIHPKEACTCNTRLFIEKRIKESK